MQYKYTDKINYQDYASGRVLYHRTGRPNFPVRLASEIFQRCLAYTELDQVSLYDPCCGGAYMLTVIGLLHGDRIKKIYGSDIDEEALDLAESNLALLHEEGLAKREIQLGKLIESYDRESHKMALESLEGFKLKHNESSAKDLDYEVFQLDIFDTSKFPSGILEPDIVMTDVPYGNLVSWSHEGMDSVEVLLSSIGKLVGAGCLLALSMNKAQKIPTTSYDEFTRVEKFIVGKRKVEILRRK